MRDVTPVEQLQAISNCSAMLRNVVPNNLRRTLRVKSPLAHSSCVRVNAALSFPFHLVLLSGSIPREVQIAQSFGSVWLLSRWRYKSVELRETPQDIHSEHFFPVVYIRTVPSGSRQFSEVNAGSVAIAFQWCCATAKRRFLYAGRDSVRDYGDTAISNCIQQIVCCQLDECRSSSRSLCAESIGATVAHTGELHF